MYVALPGWLLKLDAIIQEYSPDLVMVMSETKLTDKLHGKSYVKECAPGYQLRYSSAALRTQAQVNTKNAVMPKFQIELALQEWSSPFQRGIPNQIQ
jgi:hypothetical protein